MTAKEMSDKIDVLLSSYYLQHGFGNQQGDTDITLNEYDKSVFLTNAMYDIVRYYYKGNNNITLDGFEITEECRRALSQLIKTQNCGSTNKQSIIGNFYEKIYKLPSDLWYILYESVEFENDSDICSNNIEVIPVKLDEFKKLISNPFRKPNNKRIFRLDIDNNKVELVSSYQIVKYTVRYLAKPSPIITTDLPSDVSIEGMNIYNDCELNSAIHDLIVQMAVSSILTTKSYSQPQSKTKS